MQTIEEAVLIAVLDSDDDEATRLLGTLLPNERFALQAAAFKLSVLASGAPELPAG